MLVDSVPLVDSEESFTHGNQAAAQVYETLSARLSACGAMAGDASIAEEFAATYDDAAASCLAAVGDLVDAFSGCGRLTAASLANHGRAEDRSMISGRTVFGGAPCVAGYVSVLSCSLPSSLGGDLSGVPGWAAWILDQVEGFVWPDADTGALREAAAAWRAASHQVADLADYCATASRAFALLDSPEVPVAIEVSSQLADRCARIGTHCATVATACDSYADHVEEQRAAVLDLVHDLIRDAVIIEGIGIVLGAFTAGGTAAAAAALNAARIAEAAPRLLRIIETLRTLASSCATPVRLAAESLRELRRELAVFRRVRITIASAFDAERLARVERLRGIVNSHRLFDPRELEGLSRAQLRDLLRDWPVGPAKRGSGVVYDDTGNLGRQIRVMDGYPPGSRPNPITWGPYAEVSQNGDTIKIALEGNPTL